MGGVRVQKVDGEVTGREIWFVVPLLPPFCWEDRGETCSSTLALVHDSCILLHCDDPVLIVFVFRPHWMPSKNVLLLGLLLSCQNAPSPDSTLLMYCLSRLSLDPLYAIGASSRPLRILSLLFLSRDRKSTTSRILIFQISRRH